MIIRGLDNGGDWVFGNGLNAYKVQQDAIMQNIQTKILEWVGDCFFNQLAGIDWINRFGFNQKEVLRQELTSLILSCYGVVNLIELNVDLQDRNFTTQYSIETIFSQNAQAITTNNS